MGGVVVGIVRADKVAALRAAVAAEYHAPRREGTEDGAESRQSFFVCFPISGVGSLRPPS
jgi:galactokinase